MTLAEEPPASEGPAARIVRLLDTLPDDERRALTSWLLENRPRGAGPEFPTGSIPPVLAPFQPNLRRWMAQTLPAGEDSQLVTIRLPTEQHARLRTWCTEHGFTMAAVVRGLLERFLDSQPGAATG